MAVANPDNYTYSLNTTLNVPAASGVMVNDVYSGLYNPWVSGTPVNGSVMMFLDGSFEWTPNTGATSGEFSYYIESLLPPDVSNVTKVVLLAPPPTSTPASGSFPLYLSGSAPSSGDFPLFLHGYDSGSGSFPLYIAAADSASGSFPLSLTGVGYETGGIPLFVHGDDVGSGSFPLSVAGSLPASGTFPLFIAGGLPSSGAFPLWLQALGDQASGTFPLFLNGSTESGVFSTFDLYLFADSTSNDGSGAFPLSITGLTEWRPSSGVFPLSLTGRTHQGEAAVDLTVWNADSGVSLTLPLFVAGSGNNAGYYPFDSSLYLTLVRDPADAITLFLKAPGSPASGDPLTLTLAGSYPGSGDFPLSVPSAVGAGSASVRLFTRGY